MKIFISWSGAQSLRVAQSLRDWLPYIFTNIELFVSSEDIRKGKRWPLEVSKELDVSNFGIVCLTPDNLEAPWLLFESGALSKSVKEASVFTLLTGGLKNSDIEGPLSHFQHTQFEKDDFFKLISAINVAQDNNKQEPVRLKKVFDKFWDELHETVSKTVKGDAKPPKPRSQEDVLNEVLELTSYIAKKIGTNVSETNRPNEIYESLSKQKTGSRIGIDKADILLAQIINVLRGRGRNATADALGNLVGYKYSNNLLTLTFPKELNINSDEIVRDVSNSMLAVGVPKPKVSIQVWLGDEPPGSMDFSRQD